MSAATAGGGTGAAVDGTVLGFDVGMRRIGVAVGNGLTGSAQALAVVDMLPAGPDWAAIDRLLRQWRPDGLVVGDPMTLDGGDQPIRTAARAFARVLGERTALPVVLVDERNTSQEAARRFASARAGGGRRRRDAQLLDAMAAALIVERWFSSPRPTGVPLPT